MARIVFVNGSYLPESEGKISIFDRGFLFADGVYEVVAVLSSRLVDFDPHTERLARSLHEVRMTMPMSPEALKTMFMELVSKNNLREGLIYLQVTRGAADRDFKFPKQAAPTVIAFTQAKTLSNSAEAVKGVSVITVPDLRWARRDIKTVMLLAPVLGKQQAHEKDAFEAWMVEDGFITEGTSSNAYIVKNGRIITRALSHEILAGCTRRALLRLAQEKDLNIEERNFTPTEAKAADEAFLSSASTFVMPVVEIDGERIGDGQPGPVARELRRLYLEEAAKG